MYFEPTITGLPAPQDDHPRVAISSGGTIIAIADGEVVSSFRIDRTEQRVAAAPLWRHDLRLAVRELLTLPGGSFLALVDSEDETRAFVLDDDENPRFVAALSGAVKSAAVADGRLIAATRGQSEAGATLREIDLSSGLAVTERRLPSPEIDIAASPSGTRIAIIDRRSRAIELRSARGLDPCSPGGREEQPRPVSSVQAVAPCDCSPASDDVHRRAEEERMEHEQERDRRPCTPGDAAVPDDDGGAIVVDGGRIDRSPPPGTREDDPLGKDCWGNLFWTPDQIRWAGMHVVATQGNLVRRVAIISPTDLRVLRERDFGRQGALVFSGSDSDALVVFHPERRAFEWLEPEDDLFVGPLDIGPTLQLPPDEKTFVGQRTLSLIPESIPSRGDINVLVLPVVEPGQAYNEPNFDKIWNFLQVYYFGVTKLFYKENSFNQAHLHFHLFGHDRGPAGGPLLLPQPVASYFWPPFFAGGVELARTLPALPSTIAFEGGETMTIRVQPRTGARQGMDLTLRFAATHLRSEHDAFPVKVIIGTGQTATITARERDGTIRTLSLTFPPQTLEIEENDVAGGLDEIADYLDQVIADAEAAAGVPGGRLFAKPEVHRVIADDLEFGELHVSLSFASRPAGAGTLAVLSINPSAGLNGLGFGDAVRGEFSLGSDVGLLQEYLTRLMRQAEAGNPLTATNPVLADSASVALSGADLKTTILLSDNDGGPGASISVLSSSNTSQLFATSKTLSGGETTKNDANAPRHLDKLLNDAFTAAAARMGPDLSPLNDIHAVIVGFIGSSAGAPPTAAWDATNTQGTANLREAQKSFTAQDGGNKDRQLKARWILAFLNGTPDTATLCHELGHAFGFRDLYSQTDYRDDLRYLEDWATMDNQGDFPHHAGYHKWQAQWIPEERIAEVPKPDAGPTAKEALLVPVEFWDDGMEAAVRAAYPGVDSKEVPVAQLMRMNLGGDGGMFDLVEARQSTKNFSKHLPHSPALLVTNAILPWDDKEYAQIVGDEQRYRRELHLLNEGHELRAMGNEFDLGLPDELPAKGIKVRIQERKSVPRPDGGVEVFHVRVTREQAPTIDLGFTQHNPYWKNPDLWLDHPDPGQTAPNIWPEGEPTHQGDSIHVPPAGRPDGKPEPHWVVARVRNFGPVHAEKVRVDFEICRPPGAGDRGNFVRFETVEVARIDPGVSVPVVATWQVDANEKGHTCLRATIADYEVPEDAGTGIALASEDVMAANSEAIKNLDQHVALGASPYEPVEFDFSVNNDSHTPRTAYLQPERLPEGMRLTVSPTEQVVPPKSTVIFKCRLQLDHEVIDAGCRSDQDFSILAWRMTPETSVRWGGVQYRVRPRKKTSTLLSGGWVGADAGLNGRVDPDPGGGEVRLRINFDNVPARWQAVPLSAGGTFQLQLTPPTGAKELDAEAVYEGSRYFAPSESMPLTIRPYVVR